MGKLLFLKHSALAFPPESKVIKAEDYLAYVEASEVLETARLEAEKIIAEAKEVYEAEKRRGHKEGMEEGKGIIAERMLETVQKTVDYLASAEETLCSLVIQALKKIIGEIDDRDLVTRMVRNALALVRNQKQVVLRVSAEDCEMVEGRINEIMAEYPGIGYIDVVSDGRLKKNGCILETDIGVVDASLDVQIEAIRRSLMRSIKRAP